MNAATRAVIERLIEALEQYAPRDRAVTQDLIAEASKLLEGDALAQPADEDALEQWARRSEALISIYVTALDEQDEDRTAAPEWAAVCDHLRTRPQRAGFVSVPVEQAKDGELFRSLKWRFEEDRDMGPGGRWWVSVSTNDPKIRNDLRKVLIEAAKGDTNG